MGSNLAGTLMQNQEMCPDKLACTYTQVSGRTMGARPRDLQEQASVYIHPGDTRKEAYRLSTFRRFPASTTPVLPGALARSGFFYTGYKDRVKCFSCGISMENWVGGVDVSDKKWHRTDCEFTNGWDTTNIPLLAIYKRDSDKQRQERNGFHLPQGAINMIPQANVTPVSNNGDNQVQGTSSSGINQNIPTSSQSQSAEPRSIFSTTQQNQDRYFCLHPVNPHTRSAVSRLESFKERNGIRWPRERLRAGIDNLVNAGFFYLGERGRVKCWYCNGGLQNWDYDDEPWTEHAKWFPSCHYLLRVKGPTFVDGVVAQYPELNRPIPAVIPRPLSPPRTGDIPPSYGGDIPPPSTSNPLHQRSGGNVPPQSIHLTVSTPEQALEEAMVNLEYIQQARDMGYSDEVIKQLLKRKYETSGQFYATEQEFIEALLLSQATASSEPQNHGPRERPRVGIEDLVNAGFFYLGERDYVKCCYCNGGLHKLDYDDDQWTKHAKWFPSCHCLLRVKGPAFVNGVVDQYPETSLPVPTATPRSSPPLHSENISPSRGLDIPSASSSGPSKQYRDGYDPVISHVTPELLHQKWSIKSPKERLPTRINNLVNGRLFCPDKIGRVKCQCGNGGLQNWGNGVGPCICAVIVEELENHVSNKKLEIDREI